MPDVATVNPPFPLARYFGIRFAVRAPCTVVESGFSGATVLKVACAAGMFAIRGWPKGTNVARLRGLHRLLNHLAAHGLPVAPPLITEHEQTLVAHGGRYWQVEPWLPGQADFHARPSAARLAAAMQALAVFHTASASFVATNDEAPWFGGPSAGPPPAVADRLAIIGRLRQGEAMTIRFAVAASAGEFADLSRLVLDRFERLREPIEAELRLASSFEVPLVPCLRDVWHDHVLFTDDVVTGLIDPSACRRDTVATDLSRLLGSLLGDDPVRWDAAIAEYVRHRPLSVAEAALVPILDRSGVLLSAFTWLRRCYIEKLPCESQAVIARLRALVERIEPMPDTGNRPG